MEASSHRLEVVVVITATLLTVALSGQSPAQPSPGPERRFEAASIKTALSPSQLEARASAGAPTPAVGIRTQPGGRFVASSVTLQRLIARAFGVWDYQIDVAPSWITTDYFDIVATAGADATPAEVTTMLRALLADRFALRTHMETRESMVQALRVARSDSRLGSGIRPTSPDCEREIEAKTTPTSPASETPTTPACGASLMTTDRSGVVVRMRGAEIRQLVNHLMSELSAPVVDRTGLTGRFDITLEHLGQRQVLGALPTLDATNNASSFESLKDALRSQLGLKLDQEPGPLTMLVVDGAERPTPD